MPKKLKMTKVKIGEEEVDVAFVKEGKPIYVDDNGTETAIDAAGSGDVIARLNREAQGHREARETAEAALRPFEGLDAAAARTAIETVANLDSGELLKAGKVEEIKQAAIRTVDEAWKGKVTAASEKAKADGETIARLTGSLHSEKLTNAFANSKFIGDKLIVPAPTAQSIFGASFKIENDKIIAYKANGEKVYSSERPGEEPTFDEALELVVNEYPYKDKLIKGKGQQGGGGEGNGGGGGGGGNGADNSISRSAFGKLSPAAQMTHMQKGGKVHDDNAA